MKGLLAELNMRYFNSANRLRCICTRLLRQRLTVDVAWFRIRVG